MYSWHYTCKYRAQMSTRNSAIASSLLTTTPKLTNKLVCKKAFAARSTHGRPKLVHGQAAQILGQREWKLLPLAIFVIFRRPVQRFAYAWVCKQDKDCDNCYWVTWIYVSMWHIAGACVLACAFTIDSKSRWKSQEQTNASTRGNILQVCNSRFHIFCQCLFMSATRA